MGDHLWVGKPSQYVTGHLDQLSLPRGWQNWVSSLSGCG